MSRLKAKVALITGATGGIGEATAKRFLQEGASVVLVGRSAEKLAETSKRLNGGERVASFVADATDEDGAAAATAVAVDTFGGLDILFANAGTEGQAKPVMDLSRQEFDDVMQINVTGVWLSIKHAVPAMLQRGGGSIIVTSSIAGVIGFPTLSAYTASKHAVVGLVKTVALELADSGIRINAVAPGPVQNRMIASIESMLSPDDPVAAHEQVTQMIPMKRYASNEEIARHVLFLASEESSYITGTTQLIDGGFTAA